VVGSGQLERWRGAEDELVVSVVEVVVEVSRDGQGESSGVGVVVGLAGRGV
jgi:hypothetical protein